MSKDIIIIAILVIAIIGLAATIGYMLQRQRGEEIDKIDTLDWKVYRNEEYGFELRYPKTWVGPYKMGSEGNVHIVKDLPPRSIAIDIRSIGDKSLREFANTAWELNEPPIFSGVNQCRWIKTAFGVSGVRCTYKYLPEISARTRFGEISPPEICFETNPSSEKIIRILLPVIDPMDPYFPDFNSEIFEVIVKSFRYITKE